jgi:hypothetical protein
MFDVDTDKDNRKREYQNKMKTGFFLSVYEMSGMNFVDVSTQI